VTARARAAAALVAAALLVAARAGGSGTAGANGPSRLLVKGVEYDLTLSRASIAPGEAIVDFQNAGEDPHNLVIKRAGAGKAHDSGKPTPSGQVDQVHLKFKPGTRYVLFCSMKHHRAKGMVAHLLVGG